MAENGDAACFYPQEILDLNWSTTSKERIQKDYKVWSVCYDKVLFWGVISIQSYETFANLDRL